MIDINSLKEKIEKDLKEIKDLVNLKELEKKYLGKKGEIASFLKSLKQASVEEKQELGKKINEIKKFILEKIEIKRFDLEKQEILEKEEKEWIDISLPGKKIETGHIHLISQTIKELREIFGQMGFSIIEGPDVETEYYNFDALNIEKDHPARDMWDTFWLKNNNLLRTHTSPVQVRYMEKNNPPLRIIAPGRVFRYEATDASHEFDFNQLEGLMVDKNISVSNFRAIINHFLNRFFGKNLKTRLRPSYFPFTEPSFEIDIECINCGGKGCSTCSNTGWIELMGAGMVHPNVFKSAGYNPKNWQGFAFGVGIERLVMMKYAIDDIRWFHSNDLRFIKQF